MCHEIGHALGLSIIDPPQSHPNTKSCMNNSQHAVRHYVDPIKSDFRDLESIYKHKDPYTTLGRSASDSARSDGTDFFDPTSLPSVPSGLDGPETVTIQTLDDGGQIVTFITWVEKEP
jgi:hypothetical protein